MPPCFRNDQHHVTSHLLAQSNALSDSLGTTSSIEFDWPYFWTDWLPIILLVAAMATTIYFTLRDTRKSHRGWTFFLSGLRLLFLGLGIVLALNPHQRIQTDAFRPSRVILLVDTSSSMLQPVNDPRSSGPQPTETRAAAIEKLLADSPMVDRLRETHSVDVYTFSGDVSQLQKRFPKNSTANQSTEDTEPPQEKAKPDWQSILLADGHLTRLGDSLDKLLVETKSPTLSGVVVISDGATNAGRDVSMARERAVANGVRLVTVGVGSTEEPQNLEVARLIAPTDVQKGDVFELSAILSGQGVAGRSVQVDLLQKGPNDPEPIVVLSESTTISGDETPTEVAFDLKPADGGEYQFTVKAKLNGGSETRDEDNQLTRTVNIFDRPLQTLIIAGGPMRDYRFAKTALYRHPSTRTDVWLQTGSV